MLTSALLEELFVMCVLLRAAADVYTAGGEGAHGQGDAEGGTQFTCFTGTKVRSLLALLVQKKERSEEATLTVRSLLALLVQKYKY
jgi:hypothetical protein